MKLGSVATARAVTDASPRAVLSGHVAALDGVRGVAILWVMLFHMAVVPAVGPAAKAWATFCSVGGRGVDIFFVLSGFLITGILLDTKARPHYFRNFYARRVLRIFPLYYAVVFASLVVLPHVTQLKAAKFHHAQEDSLWYWFHLSNFAIARRGAFAHGILDVSWSLAIEEQFYLIWPLIVLVTRWRTLRGICLALVAVSCASRIALTCLGVNPIAVYTLTFCRLDSLAIGALAALSVRNLTSIELRRTLPFLVAVAAPLAALSLASAASPSLLLFTVGFSSTAVALFTAAAIIVSVMYPAGKLAAIFSVPPLRVLGRFSYAMYLFHYPLMAALRDTVLKRSGSPLVRGSSLPTQIAFDGAGILLTLVFAFASWHAYEKWFLTLKRHF